MRQLVGALALTVFAGSAFAAEDPIAARKGMMSNVGKAMGAAAAMVKGEAEFDARVGELAFRTMNAVSLGYGEMFPAGSETGGETEASPKIWEDNAGFMAAVAKFQGDTASAIKAAPVDLDGFKVAFGQVAANCKACHEAYRIKKE
jgi:cytochrome c556